MTETVRLLAAVAAGMLLGVFFFGGLWWTVRRTLTSPLAALWFSGSFLIRTAVTLTGFYFTAQGDWRRMAGCVAGFFGARVLVIRFSARPCSGTKMPLVLADSTSPFTSTALGGSSAGRVEPDEASLDQTKQPSSSWFADCAQQGPRWRRLWTWASAPQLTFVARNVEISTVRKPMPHKEGAQ